MRTFGLTLSRILLASLFIYAGVKHFANAEMFASTVPPYLGFPFALVYVSGVFEVIGGIGLLIPNVRHYASWLLMALLMRSFLPIFTWQPILSGLLKWEFHFGRYTLDCHYNLR